MLYINWPSHEMIPSVTIRVLHADAPPCDAKVDSADDDDASVPEWPDEDPVEQRQRELNDNIALIRILDDPPPFGEFGPFASGGALGSSRQRRQTLLNFVAFCLTRDDNTVALATTIQQRARQSNQLVLHVARSTGFTTSYERECATDFLRDIKRAWRYQTDICIELVWAHVIQLTEVKLRKRLSKLRQSMHDLQGADGFAAAVDAWGQDETSQNTLHWMKTWNCRSQTAALKDVFRHLFSLADTDEFDHPDMYSPSGRFRLHHSYFLPISVLSDSTFLRNVEFGKTDLHHAVVRRLRRFRRRCLKLWCYETGVHLLCTYARDSVRRIMGPAAFSKFVAEDDDAFRIDWLETPHAVSEPMERTYDSAQDALLGVLAIISEDTDFEEPFVCSIEHRPAAIAEWTPWCISTYHPELQIVDHLRSHGLRASPAFVGCSKLACRACKYYVDQLDGSRWSLNTSGLESMDLKMPEDWLIPPGEAGDICAEMLREEAMRLVGQEDYMQRRAWERHVRETIPPLDISQ